MCLLRWFCFGGVCGCFLRNNVASVNQDYYLCIPLLETFSSIITPRVLVIDVDGLKLRRTTPVS